MSQRRRATYPAARRIARLVHELRSHPHGWSFDAIKSELSIGERTLLRYVDACREELRDAYGEPLIEVVQRGSRRLLRLRDDTHPPDARLMSAVSLWFTLSMVRFLEGTVLKDSADALWDKLVEQMPAAVRSQLENLDRKFFSIAFVPKDYAAHSDIIDQIVQALVREYRLTIDYEAVLAQPKQHDVAPYTLLAYRGGLYLVGYSETAGNILWLAVERIRSAKPTPGDGPRGRARFTYPKDFDPARYTDGLFGVVEGPETEVELVILNQRTEAYLTKRTVHPSQRFSRDDAGRLRLTMKVRGVEELANWIMSLTPWVAVVRPAELRAVLAERLRVASAHYAEAELDDFASGPLARPRSAEPQEERES
ncbi:MAG TPA: WYL domain-containing protein [Candidatus Binatia bacterium]